MIEKAKNHPACGVDLDAYFCTVEGPLNWLIEKDTIVHVVDILESGKV
jgi:hypothetical protein